MPIRICGCFSGIVILGTWNEVLNLFTAYTVLVILSNLTVILATLLFKIGTAIIPREWKHKPKPRLIIFLEVVSHIVISVLALSFSAVDIYTFYLNRTDHNCNPQIKLSSVIGSIFLVIFVSLILGLFVIVFLLYCTSMESFGEHMVSPDEQSIFC